MRGLEFGLLGPVEVRAGGRSLAIPSPKHRVLLAALLLRAGRPVPVEDLADAVWGAARPGNSRRTVQLYVTRVRRLLDDGDDLIVYTNGGYQLNVRPEHTDLGRFRALAERAAQAAAAGDVEAEAAALEGALAQWRGAPLENVPTGILVDAASVQLREEWLGVVERRIEVDLRRGRHAGLAAELAGLTARYPLREPLWIRLIQVLAAAGRRADALAAYHTARQGLADDLGVDPGDELQALYVDLLTSSGAGAPTPPGHGAHPLPVPRQLPADKPGFVGRADSLARLDALLDEPARVVCVVAGMAGVGKTTLAARWARRVADRFPDGQLWADLRGFDRGPATTPERVLTRFLRALGFPDEDLPADVDEQVGLYRSLVDGRRILVVLDNARSEEQVRPLLPGAPGSLALVTSRRQLPGLIATDGAHPLPLDVLPDAEAAQVLVHGFGPARARRAPAVVGEIVRVCARLPLALAIVAARAASRPDSSVEALAAGLRAGPGSLDFFASASADPATEVRTVFSWSYRALTAPAARLFRLLALHPGPDLAEPAVASLAGLPRPQAGRLLAELAEAHLVAEPVSGRYAFHDLLRSYATELGPVHDEEPARQAARHRLYDHYLHTTRTAVRAPAGWEWNALPAPGAGVTPERFDGDTEARAWLAAEHQVLLALIDHGAENGLDDHARLLAWTQIEYLCHSGFRHDCAHVLEVGLHLAERSSSVLEQARFHRELAKALLRIGNVERAYLHGSRALPMFAQIGDALGLAIAHEALGRVMAVQGRVAEALDHDLRAVAMLEEIDNRSALGRVLTWVGQTLTQMGDHEQARQLCNRALDLQRRDVDDPRGLATTWDSLGSIGRGQGRHREAIACYRRALPLLRDLGDHHKRAETLDRLADVHVDVGQTRAATANWREAVDILVALGHDTTADRMRAKLHAVTLQRGGERTPPPLTRHGPRGRPGPPGLPA